VPGLSYQPPLFGHKRLLNFDAYSFPDVGGWVVIGAAVLAFAVWFAEWYRIHKAQKKNKLTSTASAALLFSFIFTSCAAKTEPFNYGKDECSFCKMSIIDIKFGGEVVTKKTKVYKFDDAICMIRFLQSGKAGEKEIAEKVVINFEKENDFIDVNKSVFWINPELRSPMGSNAAAFISMDAAQKTKAGKDGQLLNWDQLYKSSK
jgi:copper chaperone NosL